MRGKSVLYVLGCCMVLASCASMFDTPKVISQQATGKDGLVAWSSGSAAAVGMQASDGSPYFCVLGAAFARTGTTSTGVSVTAIPGKSADVNSSATAGALLIKNEGQTATYLDTGLFHLCMLYAQNLIANQVDRVALVTALISSSADVAKATQFAAVASLQPADPSASSPALSQSVAAAAKSASSAADSASAAAKAASAAAAAASAPTEKASGPASAGSAPDKTKGFTIQNQSGGRSAQKLERDKSTGVVK